MMRPLWLPHRGHTIRVKVRSGKGLHLIVDSGGKGLHIIEWLSCHCGGPSRRAEVVIMRLN